MKKFLSASILLFALAATPIALAQVSMPKTRQESVAAAAKLAARDQVDSAPVAVALNPLSPPKENLLWDYDPDAKKTPVSRDPAEVVKAIIVNIKPTGSVALGGEPYLLFSERRQKIGDILPVSLDGVEYNVEIVSITPTRFRIRYNGQEAERTIK